MSQAHQRGSVSDICALPTMGAVKNRGENSGGALAPLL